MKLLLDDSIKSYRLNANEACIYACIAKCTRAGKGWYGNYAALADAMPFEMNRMTASRAVQKLLTLGLIERREENHLFTAQNVHDNAQIVHDNAQIVHDNAQIVHDNAQIVHDNAQNVQNDAQIVLPPITPINNKNMNEIKEEKQQPRALHAHDGAKQQVDVLGSLRTDFNRLWANLKGSPEFDNRRNAAWLKWQQRSPIARRAMLSAPSLVGRDGERLNPYFFISDFPEPQPTFLSGTEQDDARANGDTLVQVIYNGLYKICTQQTAEEFNLKINQPW